MLPLIGAHHLNTAEQHENICHQASPFTAFKEQKGLDHGDLNAAI